MYLKLPFRQPMPFLKPSPVKPSIHWHRNPTLSTVVQVALLEHWWSSHCPGSHHPNSTTWNCSGISLLCPKETAENKYLHLVPFKSAYVTKTSSCFEKQLILALLLLQFSTSIWLLTKLAGITHPPNTSLQSCTRKLLLIVGAKFSVKIGWIDSMVRLHFAGRFTNMLLFVTFWTRNSPNSLRSWTWSLEQSSWIGQPWEKPKGNWRVCSPHLPLQVVRFCALVVQAMKIVRTIARFVWWRRINIFRC